MKIGYSQADVAKAYYDKVKPGNGYDNRKANNQFCQDRAINWDIILDLANEFNDQSIKYVVKIRNKKLTKAISKKLSK